MKSLVVALLIAIIPTLASAQQTNGCGSGWNVWVVPDSIPLARCTFASCCNDHDFCYGKCEGRTDSQCSYLRCKRGGDLFRSDRCKTDMSLVKSALDANKRRATCDNKFYEDMRAINKGKWVCEALAIVYRDAVKEWGDASFSGVDAIAAVPAWKQSPSAYNAALREFFKSGSQEQFASFVKAADQGQPLVQLKQPVRFDRARGLVNVRVDN